MRALRSMAAAAENGSSGAHTDNRHPAAEDSVILIPYGRISTRPAPAERAPFAAALSHPGARPETTPKPRRPASPATAKQKCETAAATIRLPTTLTHGTSGMTPDFHRTGGAE